MLTDERTVLPPPQVSKVGTLQYLLTVISDLFEMNNVAVRALFHECGRTSKVPSWHYFLKTLTCKEDEFVVHQANRILVQLASDGIEPLDQRNLVVYFMWLCPQVSAYFASVWLERASCLSTFLQVCRITLRSDSRAYLFVTQIKSQERDASLLALTSLCKLLRYGPYRRPFYEQGETINALSYVLTLKYDVHIQVCQVVHHLSIHHARMRICTHLSPSHDHVRSFVSSSPSSSRFPSRAFSLIIL